MPMIRATTWDQSYHPPKFTLTIAMTRLAKADYKAIKTRWIVVASPLAD
jgi:hypothetical protein